MLKRTFPGKLEATVLGMGYNVFEKVLVPQDQAGEKVADVKSGAGIMVFNGPSVYFSKSSDNNSVMQDSAWMVFGYDGSISAWPMAAHMRGTKASFSVGNVEALAGEADKSAYPAEVRRFYESLGASNGKHVSMYAFAGANSEADILMGESTAPFYIPVFPDQDRADKAFWGFVARKAGIDSLVQIPSGEEGGRAVFEGTSQDKVHFTFRSAAGLYIVTARFPSPLVHEHLKSFLRSSANHHLQAIDGRRAHRGMLVESGSVLSSHIIGYGSGLLDYLKKVELAIR